MVNYSSDKKEGKHVRDIFIQAHVKYIVDAENYKQRSSWLNEEVKELMLTIEERKIPDEKYEFLRLITQPHKKSVGFERLDYTHMFSGLVNPNPGSVWPVQVSIQVKSMSKSSNLGNRLSGGKSCRYIF